MDRVIHRFSQRGSALHHSLEDQCLREFFFGFKTPGVFVDIGGNRPQNAVSRQLLESGWTGVIVEPIPWNAQELRSGGWPVVEELALTCPERAKQGTCEFHLAGGGGEHSSLLLDGIHPDSRHNKTITVKLGVLEELLGKHKISNINLLSIDTEGTELDILRGLNFSAHRIDLILCEDWQRTAKLHRYLAGNGYKIILRTGFNSWYVPKSSLVRLSLLGRINLWRKIFVSSHIKRFHHWRTLKFKRSR
jgi:FkbM family methyltransferase